MTVYLRRRPLSSLLVVHANIPLRLPLRNAIRQSTIHWRSIAASAPLLPAKATEGGGGSLLLRPQCCTVDTVPADDAGASATPFDDAAGKTRVPVTAAAAGAAAASATAVGADCCGSSVVGFAVCFGHCCRCPSDRENVGISISSG